MTDEHEVWMTQWDVDSANAEIDRLRAELARAEEVNRAWAAENAWLSATIARVRKILRASNSFKEAYYAISAAIEGSPE